MKLKELFEEEQKTAVIGWGRFNPPTIGHGKLIDKINKEAKNLKGDAILFLSMSHDPVTTPTGKVSKKEIKNPLTWEQKLSFAQKFFDIKISDDPSLNTLISVMQHLEKQGYTKVRLIAGSDQVSAYESIIKSYNKIPDKSGNINFGFDDVEVINAGMRDPDSDGIEGMSASKLRSYAKDGDFDNFANGVPGGAAMARSLYDAVRKGMGLTDTVSEAPIEMDPADPMDPMIYGHDKANPAKLKYRMLRAAGQLKDLASRAEKASPSEWQLMARQFEELKMNMEQIRHALEELGKMRSKGGVRSRGIDPMLDGINEGYGRYWCSTDKKWKTRKGPKQRRRS